MKGQIINCFNIYDGAKVQLLHKPPIPLDGAHGDLGFSLKLFQMAAEA